MNEILVVVSSCYQGILTNIKLTMTDGSNPSFPQIPLHLRGIKCIRVTVPNSTPVGQTVVFWHTCTTVPGIAEIQSHACLGTNEAHDTLGCNRILYRVLNQNRFCTMQLLCTEICIRHAPLNVTLAESLIPVESTCRVNEKIARFERHRFSPTQQSESADV